MGKPDGNGFKRYLEERNWRHWEEMSDGKVLKEGGIKRVKNVFFPPKNGEVACLRVMGITKYRDNVLDILRETRENCWSNIHG